METFIVFWLVCGVVAAVIGSAKNRNAFGWFVLGALFAPSVLIVAVLPKLPSRPPEGMRSVQCPRCNAVQKHRALVLVLAYCGLRWGEVIALRVRDVEFLRRRLSVSENAVQLSVNHAVGPTKGRKARSMPAPAFVLDEISMQCRGKPLDELVFPGPDGRFLPRPKSSGGWFAAAVARTKVQEITPHDLRQTCASLAVSAGVNVPALQRMLGHTSAKVTLDTYADLFDDDLDAVAVTLDSRYSHHSVAKTWPIEGADTLAWN